MYEIKHPLILWALAAADDTHKHVLTDDKVLKLRSNNIDRAVDLVRTNTRTGCVRPPTGLPTVNLTPDERETGTRYKISQPVLTRVLVETLAIDEALKTATDVPKDVQTRYRNAGALLREFKSCYR